MMTFIYISFYMDFGKSCDFPLYDLFNKVKILYDYGKVTDIALKNNLGTMPSETVAVTIFTPNLNVFKDASLKQNPPIILLGTHVEEYKATPIFKLEMLIHEIRHALMSYYNTNILLDNNTYYMRSGLQETYYLKDDSLKVKFKTKKIGTILDEITNTYITELSVNRILSFKKYRIENNNLKLFLDTLKTSHPDGRYRAIGYNFEVRLLYPLLVNEMFINLINQRQFDGEIEIVKNFIENNTTLCDYKFFCQLLDGIYDGNSRYATKNNDINFIHWHIDNIKKAKAIVLDIEKNIKKKELVKK